MNIWWVSLFVILCKVCIHNQMQMPCTVQLRTHSCRFLTELLWNGVKTQNYLSFVWKAIAIDWTCRLATSTSSIYRFMVRFKGDRHSPNISLSKFTTGPISSQYCHNAMWFAVNFNPIWVVHDSQIYSLTSDTVFASFMSVAKFATCNLLCHHQQTIWR